MHFVVQTGHPNLTTQIKKTEKLIDFFPQLFSPNTESAFIIWHGIPIRFQYNFELYANFDDLLVFLEKLAFEKTGQYEFVLNTDVFLTTLKSKWNNGLLKIESDWLAKRSHSRLAEILNQKGPVEIPVMDFLREWKVILYQIINAFKKAGVQITFPEEKDKIQRLIRIVNATEGQGVLYTPQNAV